MLEEGLQTNTVQSFKGHKNMSKYVFGGIIYSTCNDVFFAAPKHLAACDSETHFCARLTIDPQKQQLPTVNLEGKKPLG